MLYQNSFPGAKERRRSHGDAITTEWFDVSLAQPHFKEAARNAKSRPFKVLIYACVLNTVLFEGITTIERVGLTSPERPLLHHTKSLNVLFSSRYSLFTSLGIGCLLDAFLSRC